MEIKRKYLAVGATVAALAAGSGVALATAGDDEDAGEQACGPDAA